MSLYPTFFQKMILSVVVTLFFVTSSMSATAPARLDLYDISDNHLMYVLFTYDADGRNIRRTVLMSDETFMREVVINYDDLGRRVSEVSFNFNGDTTFTTANQYTETTTSFSIVDQFNMDQIGGRVVYANSHPLNFGLVYEKTGTQAATVAYTEDADGTLKRVDITDQSGLDKYYGLFNTDVNATKGVSGKQHKKPQASILQRGLSQIDVMFNLRSAGEVRCELLSLSGRRAAVLFRGKMKQGSYTHRFRFDGSSHNRVANGVYLLRVSVNGVTVSSSRYLHQYSAAGGAR